MPYPPLKLGRTVIWQPPGPGIAVHIRESAFTSIANAPYDHGRLVGRKGLYQAHPVIVVEAAASGSERQTRSGAVSIGFYRRVYVTDATDPLELSSTDRADFQSEFVGSTGIFLLVDPDSADRRAGICLYHDGVITEGRIAVPIARRQPRVFKLWTNTAALAAAILLTAVFAGPSGRQRLTPPPVPEGRELQTLNLRTTSSDGECLLKWNPQARLLQRASTVSVSIHDGDRVDRYPLSKQQLQAGVLVYAPSYPDVTFAFETADPQGRRARESVTAVDVIRRDVAPPAPALPVRASLGPVRSLPRAVIVTAEAQTVPSPAPAKRSPFAAPRRFARWLFNARRPPG